jgi:GTP-binding protein YchF
MKAGIIGLPNVGKSTLFNALTGAGADASNYPFCTIEPNVGVMLVPDPRLAVIREHVTSGEVVPAHVGLVDIAGLVRNAHQGEGLGNQFLSHIREADELIEVVRCFEHDDIAHVDGSLDPVRDMDTIADELLLADLEQCEKALSRARKTAQRGDQDAAARVQVLEQCREALSAGRPVRTLELHDPEQRKQLRGMGMLTQKRVLYLANVSEDDVRGEGEIVDRVRARAEAYGGEVVAISAEIEEELAELEDADEREFLDSMGMDEPALHKVSRAALRLLDLITYFTATGDKEVRARTVPRGTLAPAAAGDVHSDMEEGFIRVEVCTVEHLQRYGSLAEVRHAGKVRAEGKHYAIRDGDICHFLFNP